MLRNIFTVAAGVFLAAIVLHWLGFMGHHNMNVAQKSSVVRRHHVKHRHIVAKPAEPVQVAAPVHEPVVEPVAEPATEPATEPAAEPVPVPVPVYVPVAVAVPVPVYVSTPTPVRYAVYVSQPYVQFRFYGHGGGGHGGGRHHR